MRRYDMMSWVYLRHVGLGIGSFYVQYDTRTVYKVLYFGSHRDPSAGVAIILSPKAQLLYESHFAHFPTYPGRLLSVSLTNTDIFMMNAPQTAGERQIFLVHLRDVFQAREGDLFLMGDFNEDGTARSEEHTSELQSRPHISYAVFCLKKKTKQKKKKKQQQQQKQQ